VNACASVIVCRTCGVALDAIEVGYQLLAFVWVAAGRCSDRLYSNKVWWQVKIDGEALRVYKMLVVTTAAEINTTCVREIYATLFLVSFTSS
jgi:hypothetical protein